MNIKKVEIARSETWLDDSDIQAISKTLDETIDVYISTKDRIINIEVKERNGLSRFWIYFIEGGH